MMRFVHVPLRIGRRLSSRAPMQLAAAASAVTLLACGETSHETPASVAPPQVAGTPLVVRDTTLTRSFDAPGVAEPVQQATLSTKLMGTVLSVRVHAGDHVTPGQELLTLDARDLAAKSAQVSAAIADAEAQRDAAATHAARFRALYADSAATRAQFDAAETGLARAEAGVRAARAGAAELDAVRSYAAVRAPFAGQVTMRMVDPGAFAAPGAPLLTVQDASRLRITVTAPGDVAAAITARQSLRARIDGREVTAVVEGVVPAGAGNLFTINALVANRDGALRAGSAAVLALPMGARSGVMIPAAALVHEGDLTGVVVRRGGRDDRRWVRVSEEQGGRVEVTSGLAAGDTIIVPDAASGAARGRTTPSGV